MLKLREQLNEILAKHTGQSLERVAQDSDRDNFMDGETAAEYGLIDTVLEKRAEESSNS